MTTVTHHGPGEVRVEEVVRPEVQEPGAMRPGDVVAVSARDRLVCAASVMSAIAPGASRELTGCFPSARAMSATLLPEVSVCVAVPPGGVPGRFDGLRGGSGPRGGGPGGPGRFGRPPRGERFDGAAGHVQQVPLVDPAPSPAG